MPWANSSKPIESKPWIACCVFKLRSENLWGQIEKIIFRVSSYKTKLFFDLDRLNPKGKKFFKNIFMRIFNPSKFYSRLLKPAWTFKKKYFPTKPILPKAMTAKTAIEFVSFWYVFTTLYWRSQDVIRFLIFLIFDQSPPHLSLFVVRKMRYCHKNIYPLPP